MRMWLPILIHIHLYMYGIEWVRLLLYEIYIPIQSQSVWTRWSVHVVFFDIYGNSQTTGVHCCPAPYFTNWTYTSRKCEVMGWLNFRYLQFCSMRFSRENFLLSELIWYFSRVQILPFSRAEMALLIAPFKKRRWQGPNQYFYFD